MPRKNHTEIICILDRSGSMEPLINDSIGGYNTFIKEQKEQPGTADVSLVLFDNEYLKLYEKKDIKTVEDLTNTVYVPRGSTALLDAIGKTMTDVGVRLSSTPEDQRPEKVLVCILTDGEENCSTNFTKDKIKEMIEHQRNVYKWEFIFLAANQDAFSEASSLGISKNYTANFVATGTGTRSAYGSMSKLSSCYRAS